MSGRVVPRTYALATATVAAGTSGYLVAAVLPDLATDLAVTTAQAGQSIGAFALAYALAAPVLAVATARWDRRTLLVVALLVTCLGNVAAAAADGLGALLAARVLTAVGAAATTPAATALAAQVNVADLRARAMAVVTGGLTAATVLGVPAGRLVADELGGHRPAFLLAALLCAAAALLVGLLAPTAPGDAPVNLGARLEVLRDRATLGLLVVSLLACLGTFTAYGYLSALVVDGDTDADLALVLLAFGVGGVIGNHLGGRAADRFGTRRPLVVTLTGCAVLLSSLGLLAHGLIGSVGLTVAAGVWGALFWAFNPPLFGALVQRDPARSGLLLGLNASFIYLGIAGAATLGGTVTDRIGISAVPLAAAVITLAAALAAAVSTRHRSGHRPAGRTSPRSAHGRPRLVAR
ncbi:MFS transporter [Umezawaea sp. Da 62-37]|uniref:MFS transporter n=1 Tax=Umezawaea sp. Da 62-37 TaxID=3075927 RepID=UPI0028F749D8|nr:MFS transporter [Umezawaea sp. Da 62-37]WNV83064.1 MFS transporter [Umezawaea sp. Da 62-37]